MGSGASGNSHHVGFVKDSSHGERQGVAPNRPEHPDHSHGNVTPGSQLCTVADEQSIQLSDDSNGTCTLTSAQQRNIRLCLGAIEDGLGVSIRLEDIMARVQLLSFKKGECVLTLDGEAKGICIVDEGVLEVMSPGGETVLNRLLPGDFCGELSAVFEFPSTATVQPEHRATVLCIPCPVVRESLERTPSNEVMLQWCARRSYVDTGIFDSGVLSCRTIETCFKASFLSVLSEEALKYLAGLIVPIIFSAGDFVYRCGDNPDFIYFVLRGAVECFKAQQPRMSKSIKASAEGYIVGREGFFTGTKRTHNARALGPLLLAPVGRNALLHMFLEHPTESSKLQVFYDAVT